MQTNFLPVDTGCAFAPTYSLKQFAAGVGATICLLTVSSNDAVASVDLLQTLASPLSIVSTHSSHYSMYNRGNINMFIEGTATMTSDVWNSHRKLDEISLLSYNWNNNGANAFSPALIGKMRDIINRISVQPAIFPTARDSIQFEYENENGDYLEFELFEDGNLKKFFFGSNGESITEYIAVEEIERNVSEFYE